MTITTETSLATFEWWSGAKANAEKLTINELYKLDEILEDEFFTENKPSMTDVNDLMWFDFSLVCELLGYTYDEDNDKIIRGPEDYEEDDDD